MEREASLKVTFFFSSFFIESSPFLVRIGAVSRSCGVGQGRACFDGCKGTPVSRLVRQGLQADLLS